MSLEVKVAFANIDWFVCVGPVPNSSLEVSAPLPMASSWGARTATSPSGKRQTMKLSPAPFGSAKLSGLSLSLTDSSPPVSTVRVLSQFCGCSKPGSPADS